MVTVSGALASLDKPLKGKLYSGDRNNIIERPIDFKGDFTGRIARKCHSSDSEEYDALSGENKITNRFIDNCLSGKTQKPLIAFSGDSHSLAIFPVSEVIASTSEFDVFSHSRDGCAFPAQGETIRRNCYEVQSSVVTAVIEQIKKRNRGSVVIATSYLNSHFGYSGDHRRQIKKHPDGSKKSVSKNLEDYIGAAKKLADKLKKVDASLVIVAPLPQHPNFIPEISSSEWFRPSPPIAYTTTPKVFPQGQRQHILDQLNRLSAEIDNIYIFDPFDRFCDDRFCYVAKGKTVFYSDDDHLSAHGARLISKDLLSMIVHINHSRDNPAAKDRQIKSPNFN
mgnify:CR=1 FL=1